MSEPPISHRPTQDPSVVDVADQRVHERRWLILGVLCLSLVMVVAGNSSLNVALPAIVRDLDATGTELQWIVDSYALVFAALLLPAGALSDRFGRKGALQFGLVVYLLAALAGTFAADPTQVIVARAVMGAGAAFVMPATLSTIANVFPASERGRAIAIWAGFAGAGAAIGPVLSGLLLESFWWGSVFLIGVPIAVLALVLGALFVPTSSDPHSAPLDPVGAALSMAGLFALLYAIIEGRDQGWSDPLTVTGFVIATFAIGGFIAWERRSAAPMLPMEFFSRPAFSSGAFTIAIVFFASSGLFFLLTLYLQFVLGHSALGAAVRTLPIAAAMLLFSSPSSALADRFGLRNIVVAGMAALVAGFIVLATVSTTTYYWVIATALSLLGTGLALVMANSTSAIMTSLPLTKAGVGSAVNDTSRQIGGAIGIAVLGSLLATLYRSELDGNLQNVPATAQADVRESIGAALRAATDLSADNRISVESIAREAFVNAFNTTMAVTAAILVIGALVAGRYMPTRVAAPPADESPVAASLN